jgi:hypothetical protein
VEKVLQHADQSSKTCGAREAGGNRGQDGVVVLTSMAAAWVKSTLTAKAARELHRISSHMQDATPTTAKHTWELYDGENHGMAVQRHWEVLPN